MHVVEAKLYWANWMEMAAAADGIDTVDELRGIHGEELEEWKNDFPSLGLEDDYFTLVDDKITDRLHDIFETAVIDPTIVDYFDDYDPPKFAEEVGCDTYVEWDITKMSMDSQDLQNCFLALSKEFPLVKFFVRTQAGEKEATYYIQNGIEDDV